MTARWPLTEAQAGIWYAQQRDPGSPVLVTGQALQIEGPLDPAAMARAVMAIGREAESLSMRVADGPAEPEHWIDPDGSPALVIRDRTSADSATVVDEIQAEAQMPMDLACGPVAAFTLWRLGPTHHILTERIHHIAADGQAMVQVTRRLAALYDAEVTEGEPGEALAPYARILEEEARFAASPARARQRDYWLGTLADLPPVESMSAGPAGGDGRWFHRAEAPLPDDLRAGLLRLAEQADADWTDVLTALTGAYVARHLPSAPLAEAPEVVLGIPLQNRMGRVARVPSTRVNVLPLHLSVDEAAPLADWVGGVAQKLSAMRRNAGYRGEALQRELGRIGAGRRLWGPLVNILPFDACPGFHGCRTRLKILGAGSVDDITFCYRGDPGAGLVMQVDTNTGLYSAEATATHAHRLGHFLKSAMGAERLAEVSTLTQAEFQAHVHGRNATAHPVPETTLTALIEAGMRANPEAAALIFGDVTLSHARLDAETLALARRLAALGIGPGDTVAVALPRSVDLIVALVGILRAGAAYVPLDPEDRSARRDGILSRSNPVAVLAEPGFAAGGLPVIRARAEGVEADRAAVSPDDPAYVLFTSGSTGTPKGVVVEHRAIVNRLLWMREAYGIGAGDRILQKTPAIFDVSVWEFFLPILSGATLVVAPPGAHRDPGALAGLIRRHAITAMHFVPSMLDVFLSAPVSDGLSVRHVFASGEALPTRLAQQFHARIEGRLHNLYGPTEAAVDVTAHEAVAGTGGASVPIGRPVWNTRCYLLDTAGRPVPDGVPGRLYLAGRQLARGYLGQPELTAERFVPDPFHPGERMYDTGDLAISDGAGGLTFVGRGDDQIKVRGARVEPAEIERALEETGLVGRSAVIVRKDQQGGAQLVAYVVPRGDADPVAIRAALAERVPQAMVPAHVVTLAQLPLSPTGKLDRKALPAPAAANDASGRKPASEMERLLARLYAEILALDSPAPVETDFFLAGGDSLRAVRLTLRLEEELGVDPGLGTILETPVLADLAKALCARSTPDHGLDPVIRLSPDRDVAAPLLAVHPAGGLAWCYRTLARALPDRPVIGLQSPLLDPQAPDPDSLSALARAYVDRVEDIAPQGFSLLGWSLGGIIAHAMTAEAERRGLRVERLVLLDAYPSDCWRDEPEPDAGQALRALLAIAGYDPEAHVELDTPDAIMGFLRREGQALGHLPEAVQHGIVRSVRATNDLVRHHREDHVRAPTVHVAALCDQVGSSRHAGLWVPYTQLLARIAVDCRHADLVSPRITPEIVRAISAPWSSLVPRDAGVAALGAGPCRS
ncbi:enterobactin synthetase component F [Palleronia marisminoris]|uniref:Dimodular nonribosomal peptide synthase n=1 Tax=Palleronia marisminoris TaxID=315423 RepID=A0A1Y5SWC5_9RHOB|nr:non-ribosomal peptide synthetase [Palleronia marisminoris]SFG94664.1 enterobactin synthetase component F [Palleronia marisminoris]SLN46536.1 Dimodular nonribosomal peptide synthase [Palleronia marisminoris]